MAGYQQLGAEIRRIAEQAPQQKPIADSILDKTALGHDFKAHNITVTQALADGDILLRHNPADGNDIRLLQDASDNTLRIHDASTGNTSAYFYPNGKAYLDLLDSTLENRHYSSLSITGGKVANLTLTGSKVADATLAGTKLQNNTLGFANYADASMGDNKIYDAGVVLNHLSGNTKSQSQGTDSLRRIQTLLGGSSLLASAGNHAHLSVNFNSVYTLGQKEASANLVTQVRNLTVQPILEPLRALVLDIAHQLMDEPDHDVVEKVRRIKEDPAYAHEFRMKNDGEYYAAWLIDNDPAYAAKVQDDPRIQEMAAHARTVYTRIENDPAIVQDYKDRRGPFA